MEGMSHALLLGEHIAEIVTVGSDFDANVVDNLKSVAFETDTLHGIVGDEAHLAYAEQT